MAKDKTTLLAGTLDLIVLKLLQAGPANGWDITQRIQLLSQDALSVNYGSLYPALHRLEARGLITARWAPSDNNRRARFYALTAAGNGSWHPSRTRGNAFRPRSKPFFEPPD